LATIAALASLQQLNGLDVENNPQLPACQVRALFSSANGQVLYQTGNNNAATCP
jgi:hypothetical protein